MLPKQCVVFTIFLSIFRPGKWLKTVGAGEGLLTAASWFWSKQLRRRCETSRCPSGQRGHLCSYCSGPGCGSHIAQDGHDPRPPSCGHGFGAQGLAMGLQMYPSKSLPNAEPVSSGIGWNWTQKGSKSEQLENPCGGITGKTGKKICTCKRYILYIYIYIYIYVYTLHIHIRSWGYEVAFRPCGSTLRDVCCLWWAKRGTHFPWEVVEKDQSSCGWRRFSTIFFKDDG